MKKNILAFDLGGSSGRAIIGTLENDVLSMQELTRFKCPSLVQSDGQLHWDFNTILSNIFEALKLAKPYDIQSIGIDTWGVDYGRLDLNGNLLENPFHYRDTRTIESEKLVYDIIPKNELYNISGIQPMRINTINQLMSDKISNNLKNVDKFLFLSDLIAYFLTGNKYAEISIASTSGLLDQNTKDWNWKLINKLGFDINIFPPIKQNGQKYGTLLPKICSDLGIKPIELIAVCQHDTASAILCTKNQQNGAYLSCGTWALMGILKEEPYYSDINFTNECGYEGKITYLNNTMGMWLIQEIKRNLEDSGHKISFAEMDILASKSSYIGLINPNSTIFESPCDMRENIVRFCKATDQQPPQSLGDFVKCIYLSQALSYYNNLQSLEKIQPIQSISIVGGGSQSVLLSQITADITNKIVYRGISEATAIGNLAVQFVSLGLVKDIEDMQNIIFKSYGVQTHLPNKKYDKLIYSLYKKIISSKYQGV